MKHILIIEQHSDTAQKLMETMQSLSYRVKYAATFAQAVESMDDEFKPDIIVAAVSLSSLCNHENALCAIRQSPMWKHLPIVCLVEPDEDANPQVVMRYGADDFIVKPLYPSEVADVVSQRLQRHTVIAEYHSHQTMGLYRNALLDIMLAHEFRTPLTSILGGTELLQDILPTLPVKDSLEILAQIHHSSQRLHQLLEDILLYAKLEFMTHDRCELEQLRTQSVVLPEPIMVEKAMSIAYMFQRVGDMHIEVPRESLMAQEQKTRHDYQNYNVSITPGYMTIAVEQLVENACRYSPQGSAISISLWYNLGRCYLAINNHGRGMSPEQVTSIGAFMQFDRARFEQQGIGMGLAIVKKIMEVFEGNLSIISVLGEETTVTIDLPCTAL